jgi:hypothetical protein
MNKFIHHYIVGAFFSLFLVLSCSKTENPLYYENEISVRAVASDQRVKLYFYLCNPNTSPGIIGGPEFNCTFVPDAYFDVYQMNPDGTEKAKLASNVMDSFEVKGLPNGVNAYFKLKARVGRTPAGESRIVQTTPDVYPLPERIPFTAPFAAGFYYFLSPDFNQVVYPINSDTFSGLVVQQITPAKINYAPVGYSITVNWDPSSRFFSGLLFEFTNNSPYFNRLFVYDCQNDSLIRFDNLDLYDFQAPVLAADRQHLLFLSNENNMYEYGLWSVNLDGSQKRRLAPDFKFKYATPDQFYSQTNLYATASPDGKAVYTCFTSYRKNEQDGLYQIDLETGAFTRLLDENWRVQLVQVSPDHRRLVFLSGQSGTEDLWVFDLATGITRQLSSLPENMTLTGSYPIYWLNNDQIVFVAVENGGALFNYKITVR